MKTQSFNCSYQNNTNEHSHLINTNQLNISKLLAPNMRSHNPQPTKKTSSHRELVKVFSKQFSELITTKINKQKTKSYKTLAFL